MDYYKDPQYHQDFGSIYISYEATDIYDDWQEKNYKIQQEEWEREAAESAERERREAEEYMKDVLSNTDGL